MCSDVPVCCSRVLRPRFGRATAWTVVSCRRQYTAMIRLDGSYGPSRDMAARPSKLIAYSHERANTAEVESSTIFADRATHEFLVAALGGISACALGRGLDQDETCR